MEEIKVYKIPLFKKIGDVVTTLNKTGEKVNKFIISKKLIDKAWSDERIQELLKSGKLCIDLGSYENGVFKYLTISPKDIMCKIIGYDYDNIYVIPHGSKKEYFEEIVKTFDDICATFVWKIKEESQELKEFSSEIFDDRDFIGIYKILLIRKNNEEYI